jgi:hypothetical protein
MSSAEPSRLRHPFLRLPVTLAALAAGVAACLPALAQSAPDMSQTLLDPDLVKVALEQRQKQQMRALAECKAFHDFKFTDRLAESNIRFEQHVVDDAGKYYKAVHYDHGCGVAVADVDGDGRLDLYFTTQLGSNQLWRNLGQGRFEDITPTAGVGLADQISVAAAFADIDNDGLPDLFVTTVRHGNHLFRNVGGGRFRDATAEAGLEYSGHSSGIVFFDFDRDGLLDLFVCNVGAYTTEKKGRGGYYIGVDDAFSSHLKPERTEYSLLYRNLGGGKFKEVSKEMNLRNGFWSGDATAVDLNMDGYPDLYVLNMQGDNHYYENQGGKGFVEKAAAYFPKTPWGGMGIKFFDFNQDGLMDVFLTDMHSNMTKTAIKLSLSNLGRTFEKEKSAAWCLAEYGDAYFQGASNNIFGNAFYLNQGQGRFIEVSDRIGAETFWPWGLSVSDLNADGYQDVFVTAGMGFGYRYAINSVLLNDAGQRFHDAEFALGVEPRAGGRTHKLAFTLDCSGADRDHPLAQGKTGQQPFQEALSSRSAVIVDLDDDGDLDIVTLDMNDRPQLLMSNLSERRSIHYLKVRLVGTASNRDGLGATVKAQAGGRTLTQYADGKSGYFGHSPLPLYFGLGEAAKVDRVEVVWPAGGRQTLTNDLPVNALLTITEARQ